MGQYRDDLDAAHSRIAALESEVKSLEEKKASKRRERDPARRVTREQVALDGAAAAALEIAGQVDGSRVPARAKRGGWIAIAVFFAAHGALARATIPRSDDGTVAFLFSWVVPLTMAWWIHRHGRVIADPTSPLVERAQSGPMLYYRSRRSAATMLAVMFAADVAWVLAAIPAMIASTQAPSATRGTP